MDPERHQYQVWTNRVQTAVFTTSLFVFLVYLASFIYIILKKGMKSILYPIMIFIMLSSLMTVTATTLKQIFLHACSQTTRQGDVLWVWDFGANLFLALSIAFFTVAIFLMAYKYWEVSWIVPLQLKDMQPSPSMLRWFKCGQISSLSFLTLAMLALTTIWLWQSL